MASRKLQLISEPVAALLQKQIAHELKNHNLYRAFANYYAVEGILDLEEYFNHRAVEEMNHHQWIFDYLSNGDICFMYPAVEANTESITSLLSPFTDTVKREIETTDLIYAIHKLCTEENDFMTISWLFKHLIPEQIEEENTSRTALAIMEESSESIFIRAAKVLNLLV